MVHPQENDIPFTYVDTEDKLKKAAEQWGNAKELGIDLECENNLHHHGVHPSLIQISTKTKNWIVDILKLEDIRPLISILKNPEIQKIFHDVSFDLRVIQDIFECRVRNIFDTQIAALLLGKTELGLGVLLENYFGIHKEQKYQMADWTKRPIQEEMLSYAIKDSVYLIKLRDILKGELKKLNRLEWAEEEFRDLEKKEFKLTKTKYTDVRGIRDLSDQGRAILKHLFALRDKMARKTNRPVHYIISTKQLMELSMNPLLTLNDWKNIKATHPIVRNNARLFLEETLEGRKEKITLQPLQKKRFSDEQRIEFKELCKKRDKLAEDFDVQKHIILNKEQIQDCVISKSFRSLRKWQKNLVKGID